MSTQRRGKGNRDTFLISMGSNGRKNGKPAKSMGAPTQHCLPAGRGDVLRRGKGLKRGSVELSTARSLGNSPACRGTAGRRERAGRSTNVLRCSRKSDIIKSRDLPARRSSRPVPKGKQDLEAPLSENSPSCGFL